MNKFHDKDINIFMEFFENDLTAIVGKEFGNLDVAGVLARNRQDNPEMSIEQATIWAMRDKAAIILRKGTALAICMDKLTIMVGQMADEMAADGNQNDDAYRNRLKVLTDFDSIVKRLE